MTVSHKERLRLIALGTCVGIMATLAVTMTPRNPLGLIAAGMFVVLGVTLFILGVVRDPKR
jgi:hypothetical protein